MMKPHVITALDENLLSIAKNTFNLASNNHLLGSSIISVFYHIKQFYENNVGTSIF